MIITLPDEKINKEFANLQIDGIIPNHDIMQKALDFALQHTRDGGNPEIQMLLLRYQEEHFTREPKILRL